MMLKSFLPGIEQRYVFVGAAVGAVLPIAFYSLALWGETSHSFLGWALANPAQCTLAAMPAWAGLVALQLGRAKRRRVKEKAASQLRERQLLHAAMHDSLTGLKNRIALQQAVNMRLKKRLPCVLMLLDLDKFKQVNDTLGHYAGDILLGTYAKRLLKLERNLNEGNDKPETAISFYRLGGDEFALLGENADIDWLRQTAEKIKTTTNTPFEINGFEVEVGVSIGIAVADADDRAFEALMQKADLALYSAKDVEGSAHAFFQCELAIASKARLDMERDLARAVGSDEFFLEYQPILCTESREVRSLEALVRWQHPEKGVLLPERFMPVAERCGLAVKLGNAMLAKAFADAASWPNSVGVSLKVPRKQLEAPGFANHLIKCLDQSGLAPQRVTFEIAEAVLLSGDEALFRVLQHVRMLGLCITMDGFGIGMSVLNRLKELEFDHVKFDPLLVRDLASDGRGGSVMDALMLLGSAMQARTAVEGIEDEALMEFVRVKGVSAVQGVLLSHPVPANEVVDYLSRVSGSEGTAVA